MKKILFSVCLLSSMAIFAQEDGVAQDPTVAPAEEAAQPLIGAKAVTHR